MVVKSVMRFSPWAPPPRHRPRRQKYRVALRVLAVEGLPAAQPTPARGTVVAAVEVAWRRPLRPGALSYLMGRKKQASRRASSRRPVEGGCAAVRWDAGDEAALFENACRLHVAGGDSGDGDGDWDVAFAVLYGNGEEEGGKVKKLETIGTKMASLAEWAKEFHSKKKSAGGGALEKELKKQVHITLTKDGLTCDALLHISISFEEATKEPSSSIEEDKTMIKQKDRQRDKSHNSGSMALDHLIQMEDEEDASAVIISNSHITSSSGGGSSSSGSSSSSGRSTPESESSSRSWLLRRKRSKIGDSFRDLKEAGNINRESSESELDGNSEEGRWRRREFVSRDKRTKLKAQTFFASIDQRDPSAGGESACTAIVAVIADALHNGKLTSPSKSEFDALIREGSAEWQKLCSDTSYIHRFPDRHFDLETVLEAKTRPIAVLPDRSFIGFFQPDSFKSLRGAMSFDDAWREITREVGDEIKVYIVSWNDHFFILKLEAEAYYVMDTLAERLYEGCNKAYILRFDDSTEMYRLGPQEGEGAQGTGGVEEVVCRGKECCREFINRFLAAIPLQEELELEKRGVEANTSVLHQRLQIELHLTTPSSLH